MNKKIQFETPSSIYIHIPFCKSKCPYCDFASWANKEYLIEKYFNALSLEIETKCQSYKNLQSASPIKTLFIGGGTPSLVAPEFYEKLFSVLKKHFTIEKDAEITLEVNPGTARNDFLSGYKKLGINRISIGIQSFNEKVLELLGRKHSAQDSIEAINKVRESGFENYSFDFIFSVPGMTSEMWEESILYALSFEPKHISAYSLIIEPNTPFEKIYSDQSKLPSDDNASDFYFYLCTIMKQNDFIHYEVSNFAKPGFESKHNLNYWYAKEYYAFGVGAHRFLNKTRTCNLRNLELYIEHPNLETILDFKIDHDFEKIMLNSRLNEGINLNLVKKVSTKNEKEISKLIKELSDSDYIELLDEKIHLTDKGLFVNNEILLKLV